MFRTFAQFLFKLLFPGGQGGMKETFGNSGGEGGFMFLHKNGIPSVVGVWIFSGTTHFSNPCSNTFTGFLCKCMKGDGWLLIKVI